jgi:hypothetical protein
MTTNTSLRRLEINAEKKAYIFITHDDSAGQDLNKE